MKLLSIVNGLYEIYKEYFHVTIKVKQFGVSINDNCITVILRYSVL